MLSKPYLKIADEYNNNYYILYIDETFYIATESVVKYNKNREFSQGLKLMPVYAPVMLLLVEMLKVEKTGEKELEGLGKEEFFKEIDVKKVRERIAELTDTVTEESMFDYVAEIKSLALRRFIDEGNYTILAIENKSNVRRNVWLAKSDKFGTLTISVAGVFGRETQKFTILDTFVYNKDIIGKALIEIQKLQIKQKELDLKELKKLHKQQNKINKRKKVEEKK